MYYRFLIDGKGLFTTLDSVLKEYENSNNPQDIANYETLDYVRGLLENELNVPNNIPKDCIFAYTEFGYKKYEHQLNIIRECIEDFNHTFQIEKLYKPKHIVYEDELQISFKT